MTVIKINYKAFLVCIVLAIFCTAGCGGSRSNSRGLMVMTENTNFRNYPSSSKGEIVFSMGKYYPLKEISKKGDWYKVKDFEGDVGWVHSSLLSTEPAAIVRTEKANVRINPDKESSIVFYAEKGCALKILDEKGDWLEVQCADGARGWINKNIVWIP
jgi:SH3-like domain-containing protein